MSTLSESSQPALVANPVEAVRAIRPILEAQRSWADENARIAPAALKAARDADVFTLFAPREVRGTEATLPEITAICEELGYADPAVGWHAGNSAAVCRAALELPTEERERIFAGPHGPFGFSVVAIDAVATPVDGGYLLNGRWPFVTGCLDTTWVSLAGMVREDGAPRIIDGVRDVRTFIVPRHDCEVVRTWETASAMRGTGSHAVTVANAFVPESMTRRLPPRPFVCDRPLFRLPVLVPGAHVPAALSVGIARRVLDAAVDLVATKVSRMDGKAYRDNPSIQQRIGEAQAAVDGLSAALQAVSAEVWRSAEVGEVPPRIRGRMWATDLWVMDQSRNIVSGLLTVSTSAVYSNRNLVETGLRDIHAIGAASEHIRDLQLAYGREILGMEPGNPMY